jgi:hypothetical protein
MDHHRLKYVAAKIFITGNKIHNPLDRNHSELRDKKVSLNDGDPFTLLILNDYDLKDCVSYYQ